MNYKLTQVTVINIFKEVDHQVIGSRTNTGVGSVRILDWTQLLVLLYNIYIYIIVFIFCVSLCVTASVYKMLYIHA